MEKRALWIPVVAGFIRKNDQVLLGQRPASDSLAGVWEFPGGKIEGRESPQKALARELHEELGLEVEVGDLKLALTYHINQESLNHQENLNHILLLFYSISSWKGDPQPIYHINLQWMAPTDLLNLKMPETNKIHIHQITEALESQRQKALDT